MTVREEHTARMEAMEVVKLPRIQFAPWTFHSGVYKRLGKTAGAPKPDRFCVTVYPTRVGPWVAVLAAYLKGEWIVLSDWPRTYTEPVEEVLVLVDELLEPHDLPHTPWCDLNV